MYNCHKTRMAKRAPTAECGYIILMWISFGSAFDLNGYRSHVNVRHCKRCHCSRAGVPFEEPNQRFIYLLMGIPSPCLWVGGIILGLWATTVIAPPRTSNPKRLPLPPGPKRYPVVGNLFALSTDKTWLLYDRWFKLYGERSPWC